MMENEIKQQMYFMLHIAAGIITNNTRRLKPLIDSENLEILYKHMEQDAAYLLRIINDFTIYNANRAKLK